MSITRTILGDIHPKLMGVTDAHEHLIRIGGGEVTHGGEDLRLPSVEKAVEETRSFLAAGGKTIVDTAPCSLGRDIRKLLEVNARAYALIIASTGFQEGLFYDNTVHWVARYTVEQIAELLVADIEEGIDIHDYMGPMVKAGYQKHITLGCDAGKKSYQKAYGAGTGFDYDLTVFVPRLREEGIPEDALEDMLVNNPARLFAIEK